jgi:hypothetical protein
VQSPTSLIPSQIRRNLPLDPVAEAAEIRSSSAAAGAPVRRHILVVLERAAANLGDPAPARVADGLRSAGVRVSVLDCYSTIADLVGHRVIGRPELVIGMLPGRGPALAAVRVAERLGVPLLALVSHDGPSSWGEGSTLRRATTVIITDERLRTRVTQAGARPERVEVWHGFATAPAHALRDAAERAIHAHHKHLADR